MHTIPKQDQYYHYERNEMLEFIPPTARRILEVGCGAGLFGAGLKSKRGCEVWGVEPDPGAARQASNVLDRVFCGLFGPALDLGPVSFDCIVFNDVLEHMTAPWEALQRGAKLLTPQGVVVASIPNIRHFSVVWDLAVHGKWEYQEAGILDETHFRFFTKSSIRAFFEKQGYAIHRCEGINPGGYGRAYKLLELFFRAAVSDMKYHQFAVVAALAERGSGL